MLIIFWLFSYNFYRFPLKIDYERLMSENNEKYWILFTDKGFTTEKDYKNILEKFDYKLHPKTIERRLKNIGEIYDFYDLPVYEKYIEELRKLGVKIRYVSNWLNGVSCEIPKEILPLLKNLPFIYDIRPLKAISFQVPKTIKITQEEKKDTSFYGYSYRQIAMLGVDKVHKKGIYGSGVRIGLLDTGLRRKRKSSDDTTVNKAVEGIKVIKEHDFIAGGDFFIAKKSNNFQKETISDLKNFRTIENPRTDYIFNTNGEKLPLLFFITDTQHLGIPKRTVVYTYYERNNWQPIKSISYYLRSYIFHHISLTNNQSNMGFVAFDGSDLYEKNKEIYFGYFYYTNFQGVAKIENGKEPCLLYSDNKLYLTFTYKDSILKIKKANIIGSEIVWQETKTVYSFNQKIKKPIIILKDSLDYYLFCLSQEGKIYYLKTNDGGTNYYLDSLNTFINVADFQIRNKNDTIYILLKEYENPPLINLSYSHSIDWGTNWQKKDVILENIPFLGNFDLLIKDKIYLTYEEGSNIYLLDLKNKNLLFSDTNEFLYNPLLSDFDNDIWLIYNSQGDDNTDYEEDEDFKEQPYHGTRMASLIAGYAPRYLIGVAPAVEFLIAKTEEYKYRTGEYYEYIIEEDNWVKGLEWCEKNGAQIISSSLGYRGWYEDTEFDGKTAITSLAASIASQRGLIIVTAMGNRGSDSLRYPWPNPYLVAPGDADGVLTIGGVMPDSSCWRGSGAGPTADGRIKPDLVALAYNAVVAKPDEDGAFEYSIGTSSATALVAGLCALILEVHPDWKIEEVKEALFKTASESIPSCTLGYGIPNIDSLLKVYPGKIISYYEDAIGDIYPQPFIKKNENEKIYFPLRLRNPSKWASLKIYNLNGKLIYEKELNVKKLTTPGRYEKKEILEEIGACWEGKDKNGRLVSPGFYFVVLETGFNRSVRKFTIFY
ncbi:MAG: S8 family serine peptidase [candidate division WOR-3 bacterium]